MKRLTVVLPKEYLDHLNMESFNTSIQEKDQVSVCELIRRAIDKLIGKESVEENEIESIQNLAESTEKAESILGYIYVAEDCENICKIGVSINFPDERVKNLTTRYYKDFKLVGYLKCTHPYKLETALHRELDGYRIKGEWFLLSYSQIKDMTKLNFVDVE